jgi:hypothetical protein
MPTGKSIKTLSLYSEEVLFLLRQAETFSSANSNYEVSILSTAATAVNTRYADSSSEDEEEKEISSSSESSDESETEEAEEAKISPSTTLTLPVKSKQISKPKREPRQNKNQRQRIQLVKQLIDNLVTVSLPVDDDAILALPSSLLGKDDRRSDSDNQRSQRQAFLSLASQLGLPGKKLVVVLLLRSGRFAGGVFEAGHSVAHRAFQRYTVRKGQGGAQSSQDNSKRKAKSMGAQLRRAGEQGMKEDILSTIIEWKQYFNQAGLILISCPKTMKTTLLPDAVKEFLSRDDPRIRKVPFDIGRPTFDSVCVTHDVLMNIQVCEAIAAIEPKVVEQATTENDTMPAEQTLLKVEKVEPEEIFIPLSAVHEAAQEGNLSAIMDLLSIKEDNHPDIDQQAGPDFMTPLHYAAESASKVDPVTAAACVSALLIQGHASPCVVDVRIRPPYFLASHDKVREAFRTARAMLGEDYCNWDEAKVGPPLTDDDIQSRKENEAEKNRRKKARQKEKKAKEKAITEEMETRRKDEEDRHKQAEDAKRFRDGLQPKGSSATNICDFCQVVCKGKRRNQMFQRLDYVYCSADCVQKHKRELMAKAAMARFGN